jgi:methylated-DNA-[protein]-cysteine S-methyltransferase
MRQTTVETALGAFRITEDAGVIVRLTWGVGDHDQSALLQDAARQLEAYAEGRQRDFDLPLAPAGTAFQKSVWDEMCRIPYGKTRSYGELAEILGSVPRAIGGACGANPIPIFIPCHRVVAGGGALGGFSGGDGATSKRALLVHEGALQHQPSLF